MSLVAAPRSTLHVRRAQRPPVSLPPVSRFLVWGFERYLTAGFGIRGGFVPRHFHALRLAKPSVTSFPAERPLVFYLNHTGWWDPITAFLLARKVVPGRHPFAPIDRAALDRYPLLERVGLFGVDRTPRGAKAFVETSRAVVARPDASLWLTPEGRFRDPRARPIAFEPGLGHLASRAEALFVPVAIEYRFWSEKLPEILALIGDPIDTGEASREPAAWTDRFERALEETLDRLRPDVESRDPRRFETILSGKSGVAPAYDLLRRMRAAATGRRYVAAHGSGETGNAP